MDVSMLFPKTSVDVEQTKPVDVEKTKSVSELKAAGVGKTKSFSSVVSNNVCDIPLSQLSIPCFKGDRLAITIPKEEYALGVCCTPKFVHLFNF